MRNLATVALVILLAGCATLPTPAPSQQRQESPFNDQLFSAQSERISADDVFALSNEMKRYLSSDIAAELRLKGSQAGLFDALYTRGALKLDYDSAMTRNAAQAFAARSGNCLSLVILTAALAKHLGLPVRYQTVYTADIWTRTGSINFLDAHVNVTLGVKSAAGRISQIDDDGKTIDFLPPAEIQGRRTRVVTEQTIVAMYMNNRAAETLAQGEVDRAYWWARAAVVEDPTYLVAYNTLGVIYNDHGNPTQAKQVFDRVLEIEPDNLMAMSNQVSALRALGMATEAERLDRRLKKLRPFPPFHFFDLGVAAMKQREFDTAKTMFEKEIQRDAYNGEFHFWLALAYYKLGDLRKARKHLAIALENSTTTDERNLYSGKLARLKSAQKL